MGTLAAVMLGFALYRVSNHVDDSAAQRAAEAASPTPRTFTNAVDLLANLNALGLGCNNYEPIDRPTGAITRGVCYVSGTVEVTIGIYASRADAEATWSTLTGLLHGVSPVDMAIGPNWTVSGPADWTRRVAAATGAEYRTQPM